VKYLDLYHGKKRTTGSHRTGIDPNKIDGDKRKNLMGDPRAGGGESSNAEPESDAQRNVNKAVKDLTALRESRVRKRYSGTDADYKKEEERLLKVIMT
jgi:hypothetical protein